ncbi:SixA phosphatase family protein [Allostreptomyces psammosilenae]|uniref:Phosphohistidine phosphatase n=1 Tax=Allostreptomyces psammosilenae TaxID=1892865 RepID=A0A852ZLR1_9ACTN|nr:histidine phosphatase family protein [Allostreptomyces psammosilenae]NYI03333.1 phosphohistidine phosphatase [Allostreptomyces psammosilenae]
MSVDTPRRIIVLRHAKADWPAVPDHERPLADRGRREATAAGRWLAETGIIPDLALCSSSVRTRETWKLVAHELPTRPRTRYEDRLYEASLADLMALLADTPPEVGGLALIGHNPGMHELVTTLLSDEVDEELRAHARAGFPTSAVAILAFTGEWASLAPHSATLVGLNAPAEPA